MSQEDQLVEILHTKHIDFVATLPCDKIKNFLSLIKNNFHEIPLTREADGLGICAGLVLAGRRPAMVIQNTGLGNAVTDIASLFQAYQLPLPILVSWRGVYKEPIEVQKNLGEKTPLLLETLGVPYTIVERPEELELVASAVEDAYQNERIHVVLLSPQVWERSTRDANLENIRHGTVDHRRAGFIVPEIARNPIEGELTRYEAIKLLMKYVQDQIVVSNIGIPSKELFSIKDRPLNFYMLGSMGLATPIGVGLSVGQDREIWVVDGDGSLLMNPNALLGLSMFGRSNLTVFAIDNASWGSTGSQITPTLDHFDLELLAHSTGIKNCFKVNDEDSLKAAVTSNSTSGPKFVHFITKPGNTDIPAIPLSALQIKNRFLASIK